MDNGIYRNIKTITLVEQNDRNSLTKSPLIGKFRGALISNPSDVFDISIDYFDSTKYVGIIGIRNFYWISNFPKNYRDNTSSWSVYPEL